MSKRAPGLLSLAVSTAVLTSLAPPSGAQSCHGWTDAFPIPGADDWVWAQTVWDDGGGPDLYLVGAFEAVGTVLASGIVRWDGSTFSALEGPSGEGLTHSASNVVYVYDVEVFDDGTGPALYAAGGFDTAGGHVAHGVARWDGTDWSSLGSGLEGGFGAELEVWDDGDGPDLYVGGWFKKLDGAPADYLARWDGSVWSELSAAATLGTIYALRGFDDGSGPALYVSGAFLQGPGVPHDQFVRFDGASYQAVGNSGQRRANDMIVFDDGTGAALYAGLTTYNGGSWPASVERWDGTIWTPVGLGTDFNVVNGLALFDDGSGAGPQLYASGGWNFTPTTMNERHVSRWDGTAWSEVGGGTNGTGRGMAVFDEGRGAGPQLFVGGDFEEAGGEDALNLVRLDGSTFAPVVEAQGSYAAVQAAVEFDDGSGAKLYAGLAGANGDQHVMAWDGSSWTPLGGAFDEVVRVLATYDDGGGMALYAGGDFSSVGGQVVDQLARWSGTSWESVGGGLVGGGYPPFVAAMTVFDFGHGPELVVGGRFQAAGNLPDARRIAAWNGAQWRQLSSMGKPVHVLAVFDPGTGPELYAGGAFQSAGGNPVNHVTRWNGSNWAPLLGGVSQPVYSMAVHDDGNGPALFMGGNFSSASGIFSPKVARWDGASWSSVGTVGNQLSNNVEALCSFDDGEGEMLYAGGTFETPAAPSKYVARWDGTTWTAPPGGEMNGFVHHFVAHDDGAGVGPSLFAFGDFTTAGEAGAFRVARSSIECPCPPTTYCTSKVNSAGCTPAIGWSGTYPSASQASGFFVTATNTLANKSGLFFYGYTPKEVPYQGGYLCVQAPAKRTPLQNSGGGGTCGGMFSYDFNARIASGIDPTLTAGTTIYGQYWSRDLGASFNTNRTDAIEFVICP